MIRTGQILTRDLVANQKTLTKSSIQIAKANKMTIKKSFNQPLIQILRLFILVKSTPKITGRFLAESPGRFFKVFVPT